MADENLEGAPAHRRGNPGGAAPATGAARRDVLGGSTTIQSGESFSADFRTGLVDG